MVFIIVFIIVLSEGKNYTVVNNYSFLKEKKNEKEKRKGKKKFYFVSSRTNLTLGNFI